MTYYVISASIAAALLVGVTLQAALFMVRPRTTAILCRRGHFARQVGSGLHIKLPSIERVVGTVAHDARRIDVTLTAQTIDPIEIRLVVAVEYFVLEGRAHDVFFDGSDVSSQMYSALRLVVRDRIPELKLATLLADNEQVAADLQEQLAHGLRGLGYGVRTVAIVNVDFEGEEGTNPEATFDQRPVSRSECR